MGGVKDQGKKNTKLHFVKVLNDLRTMQPNRFETVYLRENKKERLFCIGSYLINFYFLQGEILERNMFVHLLDPNISIFCKCCFFYRLLFALQWCLTCLILI